MGSVLTIRKMVERLIVSKAHCPLLSHNLSHRALSRRSQIYRFREEHESPLPEWRRWQETIELNPEEQGNSYEKGSGTEAVRGGRSHSFKGFHLQLLPWGVGGDADLNVAGVWGRVSAVGLG